MELCLFINKEQESDGFMSQCRHEGRGGFFFHSFGDGRLGCFQFLAIVNSATMYIEGWDVCYLFALVVIFSEYRLRSRIPAYSH